MNTTDHVTRIVVVGGGYAGTMAANRLAGQEGCDVVLLNARPRFVERIRLHQWVAETGEAAHDLDALLGDGVRLVVGVATLIDTGRRHVVLESGDELPYDRLVYAVGSTSKSGFEHAFTVGDWESAQRLREHLATERGPVTVVGGGLTGVE
ncbi:MAG TPA: FAD-dependent oxidoreductase, partial [Gordonia sp. (in: high G+C Gram-positive bacteria)]|nr:FAD-dependent oxidoreductase [Gordonia sp. (in: high G+C Gram-positive bacteria)]